MPNPELRAWITTKSTVTSQPVVRDQIRPNNGVTRLGQHSQALHITIYLVYGFDSRDEKSKVEMAAPLRSFGRLEPSPRSPGARRNQIYIEKIALGKSDYVYVGDTVENTDGTWGAINSNSAYLKKKKVSGSRLATQPANTVQPRPTHPVFLKRLYVLDGYVQPANVENSGEDTNILWGSSKHQSRPSLTPGGMDFSMSARRQKPPSLVIVWKHLPRYSASVAAAAY
ncbi:hypothetical protein H4582DRAFT_2057332 [Lactarius indigo]|nr:hypothetical protein H4582DRAFT_2057332 [Lactarius indigo]